MTDTADPQKAETTDANDTGSFASWQKPVSLPATPGDAPRTLTGMGPLGAQADSAAALERRADADDEEDEDTGTGDRVSRELPRDMDAAKLVDDDGDDEPTTVFSTLFPELVPKKVVPSVPPPPQVEGKSLTMGTPSELVKAEPVLDLAALEQQGAITRTAVDAEAEDLDGGSATNEAQILDFAVQRLGRSDSSGPRFSPPPHPRPPIKSGPPAPPRSSAPSPNAPTQPRASAAPVPPRASGAPPVPPRRSSAPAGSAKAVTPDPDSLLALAATGSRSPSSPAAPPPPPPAPSTAARSAAPSIPFPSVSLPPPRSGLDRASDPSAKTVMAASKSSEAPWAALTRPPQGRSMVKSALAIFALSAVITVLVLRFFTGGDAAESPAAENAERAPAAAAASTGNAGLHVRAAVSGLRVSIDGQDRGEVPLTLGGLPAGEVTLTIAGNPLYAPFTQTVKLEPDAVLTLEPKLVPLKAVIAIRPGDNAQGAFVEVVGGEKKQALFELPARVEVAPGKSYRVRATRRGYQDFETEVAFAQSEAEKEVRIHLEPATAAAAIAATPPRAAAPEVAAPPRTGPPANLAAAIAPPAQAAPVAPATPAPAVGTGTLNLNSIPISNVLVDGRPVGPTPRQIAVPPGKHSVTFVHPTLGRKSVTVNVAPGKTALAATKF